MLLLLFWKIINFNPCPFAGSVINRLNTFAFSCFWWEDERWQMRNNFQIHYFLKIFSEKKLNLDFMLLKMLIFFIWKPFTALSCLKWYLKTSCSETSLIHDSSRERVRRHVSHGKLFDHQEAFFKQFITFEDSSKSNRSFHLRKKRCREKSTVFFCLSKRVSFFSHVLKSLNLM